FVQEKVWQRETSADTKRCLAQKSPAIHGRWRFHSQAFRLFSVAANGSKLSSPSMARIGTMNRLSVLLLLVILLLLSSCRQCFAPMRLPARCRQHTAVHEKARRHFCPAWDHEPTPNPSQEGN